MFVLRRQQIPAVARRSLGRHAAIVTRAILPKCEAADCSELPASRLFLKARGKTYSSPVVTGILNMDAARCSVKARHMICRKSLRGRREMILGGAEKSRLCNAKVGPRRQ